MLNNGTKTIDVKAFSPEIRTYVFVRINYE